MTNLDAFCLSHTFEIFILFERLFHLIRSLLESILFLHTLDDLAIFFFDINIHEPVCVGNTIWGSSILPLFLIVLACDKILRLFPVTKV